MLTKNPSTALGSVIVLLSVGVLYLVSGFSDAADSFRSLSPKVFPEFMGYALLFLGCVIFFQGAKEAPAPLFGTHPSGLAVFRAIAFVLLTGAHLALLPKIGFLSASALFMATAQMLLGERRILANLLKTVFFVFATHYLFSSVLRVPLPRGPWGF